VRKEMGEDFELLSATGGRDQLVRREMGEGFELLSARGKILPS